MFEQNDIRGERGATRGVKKCWTIGPEYSALRNGEQFKIRRNFVHPELSVDIVDLSGELGAYGKE